MVNGYCVQNSKIHLEGDPLKDIKEIKLKPVFKTLPNNHRNFSKRQIKKFYLDPFFCNSLYRYINMNMSKELTMQGVEFVIEESSPDVGVVTSHTKINLVYDSNWTTSKETKQVSN